MSGIISAQTTRRQVHAQLNDVFDTLQSSPVGPALTYQMVIGQWVVWAMSLGSNVLATVLIGYKA